MTIEQELEQANADLKTAREQAQKNYSELQTAQSDNDASKKQIADLQAENEKLGKALKEANEKIGKHADELKAANEATAEKVNAEAVRILSAAGQPPVPAAPENKPNGENKPDLSKLTGLEKAIAAHKLSTK